MRPLTVSLTLGLLALCVAARAEPLAAAPIHVRTDGLVADLFLPPGEGRVPAVMVIGGSEGGLGAGAAREADLIARRGYAVLQVAYFGEAGQPDRLRLIPLETFTRALDWLEHQPRVDAARVGVTGTSKGAEAALLLASRRPDIKVVVVGAPSSVAWAGIDTRGLEAASSWTENGRPLPFMPYGWTGHWKGVHALYEDGLAQGAAAHADAEIPVERIAGPVFMVCGEADTLWPSCPMARKIVERLGARGFTHAVTLTAYPAAGHPAFGSPAPPTSPNFAALGSLGGSAEANAAARADSWPRALAAFDAVLKPSGP